MLYLVLYVALPLVIPFALIKLFHRLRVSSYPNSAAIVLVLMFILGLFMAWFTVASFGGAFGPGGIIMMASIPVAFVGLGYHLSLDFADGKLKTSMPYRKRGTRLLIAIFMLVYLLSPFLGYTGVTGFCFSANAAIAQPIIDALEAYRAVHGNYPANLQALVPVYLPDIPSPICLDQSSELFNRAYTLELCNNYSSSDTPKYILWLDVVQGGFPQRYNLQTGEWSSISFFDGVCSYLD